MFSNILLELMVSRLELKRESVNQRQARIIELVSKGKSLSEIAGLLHVHVSTISRDFQDIRGNAQKTTDQYLIETAPLELTKCLVRLNAVSDEAWALVEQASDHKEKIAALSLAMKAAVAASISVPSGDITLIDTPSISSNRSATAPVITTPSPVSKT